MWTTGSSWPDFDRSRLFYTRGGYGLFQSVDPKTRKTCDNEACVNCGEAYCPKQIEKQAVCIQGDIGGTLKTLLKTP